MDLSEQTIKLCYMALQKATITGADAKAVAAALNEIERLFAPVPKHED